MTEENTMPAEGFDRPATHRELVEVRHEIRQEVQEVREMYKVTSEKLSEVSHSQDKVLLLLQGKEKVEEVADELKLVKQVNKEDWLRFHMRMITLAMLVLAITQFPQLATWLGWGAKLATVAK